MEGLGFQARLGFGPLIRMVLTVPDYSLGTLRFNRVVGEGEGGLEWCGDNFQHGRV